MLIVGDRINTSRKSIVAAVRDRDAATVQEIARRQVEAGAEWLNINMYSFIQDEAECMEWTVRMVQQAVNVPLSLDSHDPEVIEVGLKVHQGKAVVNSITGERKNLKRVLPLVQEHGCSVIALCMDDAGVPDTAQGRFEIAFYLVEVLTGAGISRDDIYLDPLVQPIGIDFKSGSVVLESTQMIASQIEGVHLICGLNNVSSGMPQRSLLNRTFLVMLLAMGLDAAILNPLDRELMASLIAAQTLLGQDEFCRQYLAAYRGGKL